MNKELWKDIEVPESPDGLTAEFDLEASKNLGSPKALVFRTDNGYFFEGADEYINEELIKKRAPKMLARIIK